MKFSPLKFQASLAAAGLALMPYNYMKSAVFTGKTTFDIISFSALKQSSSVYFSTLFLSFIMGVVVALHLAMTLIFLKDLFRWIRRPGALQGHMESPLTVTALFSPLISLPMSMLVILGPLSFFVPQITAIKQQLMPFALVLLTVFWILSIGLELKSISLLAKTKVDLQAINFGWLLDVLGFGAISLFGSSLATAATNQTIASWAGSLSLVTITVGLFLFSIKSIILFTRQIQANELPKLGLQPAFYLIIPPLCLLGVSANNIVSFMSKTFDFQSGLISFSLIVGAYISAILWFALMLVILKEYFIKDFLSTAFSPAQWGIV